MFCAKADRRGRYVNSNNTYRGVFAEKRDSRVEIFVSVHRAHEFTDRRDGKIIHYFPAKNGILPRMPGRIKNAPVTRHAFD